MTSQAVFTADLARYNAQFEKLGAIFTADDGWVGIDSSKVPAQVMSAYSGLISYGYANGLI